MKNTEIEYLPNDIRTKYIGGRFTEKEKAIIEHFAEQRDMSLSELLRQSVFSHLAFLKGLKDVDPSTSDEFLLVRLTKEGNTQ